MEQIKVFFTVHCYVVKSELQAEKKVKTQLYIRRHALLHTMCNREVRNDPTNY